MLVLPLWSEGSTLSALKIAIFIVAVKMSMERHNHRPLPPMSKIHKLFCFAEVVPGLSISEGSVFPDYSEVATAVVVSRGVDKTSPRTWI